MLRRKDLQPRTYVTDGTRLLQVLAVQNNMTVVLENVSTGDTVRMTLGEACTRLRLVREPPGRPAAA